MTHSYVGTDLEAMSFAINYHRWILDEFRPFLGKRIVEVGAGTGDFSELLLSENPKSLVLVEPSEMVDRLTSRFAGFGQGTIKITNSTFVEYTGQLKVEKPDSIVYVNVLEHIEDDRNELSQVSDTLVPGGRVFIFVPAHAWLFGEFDRSVGHFRRYSKKGLEGECRNAGFEIIHSVNFDFFGVIPWWITYRLLRRGGLNAAAVNIYDKLVVPVAKAVEPWIRPPIGKNLLVVGERK